MRILFRILLVLFVELLILCFALDILYGESGLYLQYRSNLLEGRENCFKNSVVGELWKTDRIGSPNPASLRRIKTPNMDMVFMTPTPLGAVTLTHDRFAEHIAGRHIVTIENIRTTLFYPEKVYRSRNRWVFEKGDVRVVVTQEGLVTTAYIMDGR